MASIVRLHYYPATRRAVLSEDTGLEVTPIATMTFAPSAKMRDLTAFINVQGYQRTNRQAWLSGGECWVYILAAKA